MHRFDQIMAPSSATSLSVCATSVRCILRQHTNLSKSSSKLRPAAQLTPDSLHHKGRDTQEIHLAHRKDQPPQIEDLLPHWTNLLQPIYSSTVTMTRSPSLFESKSSTTIFENVALSPMLESSRTKRNGPIPDA